LLDHEPGGRYFLGGAADPVRYLYLLQVDVADHRGAQGRPGRHEPMTEAVVDYSASSYNPSKLNQSLWNTCTTSSSIFFKDKFYSSTL
jgi:hypothetical protein